MTIKTPQPRRVEAIFLEAIELPSEQRAALLERQCGGDEELRRRVQRLLDADATNSDAPPLAESVAEFPQDHLPRQVGAYCVRGVAGEGGMGAVYDAVHEPTGRRAAIKLVRAGVATLRGRERLRIEAESLSRLSDPGIAQIYDAGVADVTFADGTRSHRPFIAMEFVQGESIVEYATNNGIELNDRLRLIERVARAVHHAHQRGVIHRDIKPSNILITADGSPKVVDFGIARITDATADGITVTGQVIGTVRYMSPEQASGDHSKIDTRADVYGIGAILYELIAQRPLIELDTGSTLGAAMKILNTTPLRLDSIVPDLPRDLVAIVHKAIEREAEHRYGSAQALAEDLDRFLNGREVSARSPTTIERFVRVVRRNKSLSIAIFAAGLAVIVGAVVSNALALIAKREAAAKTQALNQAQTALDYLSEMLSSATPDRAGRDARVVDVAKQAVTQLGARFKDQPLVLSAVQLALGRTLLSLGQWEDANKLLTDAYQTRLQLLGDDDRLTVDAELARNEAVLTGGGTGPPITIKFRRPAEWYEKHLGPEDRQTLHARSNLSDWLSQYDRHDEAIALRESNYETYRRVYGEYDDDTVNAAELLGGALVQRRGDVVRAIPLLRSVIEAESRKRGEGNARALLPALMLAQALNAAGKPQEVIAMLEPRLARVVQVYGENHPYTTIALRALAVAYRDTEQFDLAQPMFERAIEAHKRAFGEHDGRTLSMRIRMADLWLTEGRLDDAERLVRDVLVDELEHQPSGGNAAAMLAMRARVLLARHRPADALRTLELARDAAYHEVKREPMHPLMAVVAHWMGVSLLDLGRPADAEICLREAAEIFALRWGADATETRRAQGKLQIAEQTRAQQTTPAVTSLLKVQPENPETDVDWYSRWADLAVEEKQFDAAAKFLRQAAARADKNTARPEIAQQLRVRAAELEATSR